MDWYETASTLTRDERDAFLRTLTPDELAALWYDQPSQVIDLSQNTLMLTGRGAAKTSRLCRTLRHALKSGEYRDIAICSPTPSHFKKEFYPEVLANFLPEEQPDDAFGDEILHFPYFGQSVNLYSGAHPNKIRSANVDLWLVDELFHVLYPEETWTNIIFSLRRGENPRWVIASTPNNRKAEALDLAKRIRELPDVRVITGTIEDNPFVSRERIEEMRRDVVHGSARYVEEFKGILTDEVHGAVLSALDIQNARAPVPDISEQRIVIVAVDPALTTDPDSDETGIVVMSVDYSRRAVYTLADLSGRHNTHGIALMLDHAAVRWGASAVVVESNAGGQYLEGVIHSAKNDFEYWPRWASKSKYARIEPCAARLKDGQVWLCDTFDEMEEQMKRFNGADTGHDDRVDAWATGVGYLLGI